MNDTLSSTPPAAAVARRDGLRYATIAIAVAALALCGITGVGLFLHRRGPLMDELHTWSGLALLVVMALHLVRHRRPLGSQLRHWPTWLPLAFALVLAGAAVVFSAGHGERQHGPGAQEDRAAAEESHRAEAHEHAGERTKASAAGQER